MNDNRILISCSFGTGFDNVYPCVDGERGFFFSNNPKLRKVSERKGWNYRFVRSQPLTSDLKVSSIQSKYIKFLQFFNEFPEFRQETNIIYFDHKFSVQSEHLDWIADNFEKDKSILIRYTSREKNSIADEIDDAINDERYAQSMTETISWLNNLIKTRGIRMERRIMNTGLIAYRKNHEVMRFLNRIYDVINELSQPECQIIWAALSQEIDAKIHAVEWSELNPNWAAPPQRFSTKLASKLRGFFV